MRLCYAVCQAVGVHGWVCKVFTVSRVASRRATAVPAFSPPDSPLFQFPLAYKVWLVLLFDYNACVQSIASASLAAYVLGFLPHTLIFISVSAGC